MRSRRLRPGVVVSVDLADLATGATNHFRFDAHRVKLLLVHGSGLCAVVRNKDKTLAYAELEQHFYAGTKTVPFCLNISIVSGMWSNR